nr:hypothetical protein [Tanacetum cinerariifolium]
MEQRSENAQNLEEFSMLRAMAASSKDSWKKLTKELEGLETLCKGGRSLGAAVLGLEAVDLEKTKLVKGLLPLAIKKLFKSEHFDQASRDLQQKAITFEKAGQSFELFPTVEDPSI